MASLSESCFVVCPFSGADHFITGNDECPDCGRPHNSYRYIKGKRVDWYKKQDMWVNWRDWVTIVALK